MPSGFASLSSARFQVLFHSPFGVLFIFPSRYLFAIGLLLIFSLRRNLPPTLRCIPKQRDSPSGYNCLKKYPEPHGAVTLSGGAFQTHLGSASPAASLFTLQLRPEELLPQTSDFHAGLLPLHSPLLGESWLFSFPPLTKMLQFSG
jgi:hypothetical protein